MTNKNLNNLIIYNTGSAEEKEKALEELVEDNKGLVYYVAKKYTIQGVDFEDLIQEGIIGLIKAINRYDISRTTALSTYALPFIKKEIIKYIQGYHSPIKLSADRHNRIWKVKNAMAKGFSNIDEIAEITGYTVEQIEDAFVDMEMLNCLYIEQEEEIIEEDKDNCDIKSIMIEEMKKLLTLKDYDIICRRFGIDKYYEPQSLDQIGRVYNITKDDVYNTEKRIKDILIKSETLKNLL